MAAYSATLIPPFLNCKLEICRVQTLAYMNMHKLSSPDIQTPPYSL